MMQCTNTDVFSFEQGEDIFHLFFDVLISSLMMVGKLQRGTVEKVSRLMPTEEVNELFHHPNSSTIS